MKIIPLSEGAFSIDKTKVFIPFNVDADDLQARSTGSLLVEVQPFAVITQKDILIIDCGLGFNKEGQLQIHKNLADNNINYKDVTKVLLSHLHKDHAGGIAHLKDNSDAVELSFPNAVYYVQQAELDYALKTGKPSYITDELEILQNNSQVVLLNGDEIIDGYIECLMTCGHSPHHQAFKIKEGQEIVFFGGDEAPQLSQMKNRFIAKYDYDGKKAMELRRTWWQQGREEGWKFLFYHDIKTPVYPS